MTEDKLNAADGHDGETPAEDAAKNPRDRIENVESKAWLPPKKDEEQTEKLEDEAYGGEDDTPDVPLPG
ncbi:MAG TPA: hypothetical protein VGN49_05940 [Micrococcaceae bacterium]|jgi:hypothetical protein|nr:hypothetical protein [Micrococcaceae bacterium]